MRVHDGKARGEVVSEALTSRHRVPDREITQRQDVALHGYPHIVGASAKVKFTHDEHSVVPEGQRDGINNNNNKYNK